MNTIPALLKTLSGETVTTAEQWETFRRPEIMALFSNFVYGVRPVERPADLHFKVIKEQPDFGGQPITYRQIQVCFQGYTFTVHGYLPQGVSENIPSFVYAMHEYQEARSRLEETIENPFIDFAQICRRGYGIFVMPTSGLYPDWEHKANYNQGVCPVFTPNVAARTDSSWATISIWGWGASRVLDYIETLPYMDAKRVTVVGHSRGGKTALWCAAQDTRFACAISNNSGCAGAAMHRTKGGEHIKDINITDWFCGNYRKYNDREEYLPVDQHMLLAAFADRYVYVASSDADDWADPAAERLSCRLAGEAFALYGRKGVVLPEEAHITVNTPYHEGNIGYHVKTGDHGITHFDWKLFLDFADAKLRKQV